MALHAVRRAGAVQDRHVLATGAGPIGCLVVAAAKAAGAARVTVTDLLPQALSYAVAAGADAVVRADDPADPGWPTEVDVAVEASGVAAGLDTCLRLVRRGGVVVQLGRRRRARAPSRNPGQPGRSSCGARSVLDAEFDDALVRLAAEPRFGSGQRRGPASCGGVGVHPAADRSRSCKVLLDFEVEQG